MLDKMKQLMEMKKQADQIKKELEGMLIQSEEVSGIKIEITGAQTFQSLTIEPGLVNPENKEQLEKDLLRSVNAALKKAQSVAAKKMSSLMPGL